MPAVVTLFPRPILESGRKRMTLGALVSHVMVHEIGIISACRTRI